MNGEAPLSRGFSVTSLLSRILSRVTISLRCTRLLGGPRQRSLLHLAPDGVWLAGRVATAAGGLCPPFRPYRSRARRSLSVPLSVGFPAWVAPLRRTQRRCPSVLPCSVGLSSRPPERGRGHPACITDGNAIWAIRSSDSARIVRHSGQASAPRTCRTNSPHEAFEAGTADEAPRLLVEGGSAMPRSSQAPELRHLAEDLDVLRVEGLEAAFSGWRRIRPLRSRVERLHGRLVGRFVVADERDDDLAGRASACLRTTTTSPSRIPASIIESP